VLVLGAFDFAFFWIPAFAGMTARYRIVASGFSVF